jgi:hypothetical protein
MFLKKGLGDSSLIRKLSMKNPRMSEQMFSITNKYALAEEAILDTREQKKESGHPNQPSSSKGHDKKRKLDHSVNTVERPHCHKEYRPRLGEFEGFLDHIFIFHPQGKQKTRDCDWLQGFADEVLKMADHEKKPEDPKDDFPEVHKEVNYIFGVSDSYEPKRKQKLTAQEVLAVGPATPEYIRWSEVPITFDRSDHPDFIPKPGQYPLVVCPIVKDVKLNRVLVDGGSSLNLLFLKTFNQMGLSRSLLHPSWAPFHGLVPGTAAMPMGQISLPVTFGTRENFWTKNIHFKVADFETTFNAFLRWLALTKFMAIPNYTYLVLKMPGPRGATSIRGDVKRAYDCDKESCEMADRLTASAELWELQESLAESPPNMVVPDSKASKMFIQLEDGLWRNLPRLLT